MKFRSREPMKFDPIDEARCQWDKRWHEGRTMAAATSIMRAQQLVVAEVNRSLKPFGLTFARYEALVLLYFSRRRSLPLGKMGERLMIHPTSVTSIVDRLERDGLVRRVAHADDRRIVLAELTLEGTDVVKRATKAVEATQFGVGALSERDLETLTKVLTRLRRASGDFTTLG